AAPSSSAASPPSRCAALTGRSLAICRASVTATSAWSVSCTRRRAVAGGTTRRVPLTVRAASAPLPRAVRPSRPAQAPDVPGGPMYAVIATGGKQYKVHVGDELDVEKLDAEADSTVTLTPIMLV